MKPVVVRLVATAFFFVASSAQSLDVTFENDGEIEFLMLSGEIVPGDAEKVARAIAEQAQRSDPFTTAVRISSMGGSVLEAMKIGSLMKGFYASVKVVKGGYCVSACFLIWLNGAVRMASETGVEEDSGRLIIHRPYYGADDMIGATPAELGQRQMETMKAMREYLEDSLVPRYLIDEMLSRPSNDRYTLSDKDIRQLGELPPWFEEVSVARCNYRRTLVDEIVSEVVAGHEVEAQRLRKMDEGISQCLQNIRRASASVYMKKLSTGWRPWI